jgi:4-hydroxybenzoate polyprenyltransferase
LLFVPLFASQRLNEPALIGSSLLAFASFCSLASGLYAFNDLLDLSSDRRHPRKKLRPIPSGQLPLRQAVAMVPLLLAAAFAIASYLPVRFQAALALYCGLTLAYSLRLKQIVLLDVIVLASLYIADPRGGAAVDTPVSRWLLAALDVRVS